ncbi:MAG: hypothetical protein WC928_01525 [Patescibacteria group bacterium]|jgi:hypothetical protein
MEDICMYAGKEAIFLYGFILAKDKWLVDILFLTDAPKLQNKKIVPYDEVQFVDDKKGEKKKFLLEIEIKKRRKERVKDLYESITGYALIYN